jgi:hypothetical protein
MRPSISARERDSLRGKRAPDHRVAPFAERSGEVAVAAEHDALQQAADRRMAVGAGARVVALKVFL